MKMSGEVEMQFNAFLMSALDGVSGELQNVAISPLGERVSGTH